MRFHRRNILRVTRLAGSRNPFVRIGALILTLTVIASITLTSCSNPYKERFDSSESNLGQRNEQDQHMQSGPLPYGYTRKTTNHHDNKKMEISQVTSTEIGRMDGIAAAHVMITDLNAYVGVMLDDSATGTAARGNLNDTDNTGEQEGLYDARDGSPYADYRKIALDRNSYFNYPDPDDISSRLKLKIALKVRELNPQVQEVFITSNRNFVNELNGYAIEYWSDRSLDSYVEEFNRKVKHYFPPPSSTR